MYVKIEPSGCNVRKGMVEIRFCMYLDPTDYGYDKKYIQTEAHPGLNTPFHNHFIQVEPDTKEKEIMDIAEAFLHEAYAKWAQELDLDLKNKDLPFKFPDANTIDKERLDKCAARVEEIKLITTERKA